MVADPGEILDPAAANKNDGMFLQIMAFPTDVGGHFMAVGEPDTGDLAQGGIRLLGSGGIDARADTALLGTGLKRRDSTLAALLLTRFSDQLVNRRHYVSFKPDSYR